MSKDYDKLKEAFSDSTEDMERYLKYGFNNMYPQNRRLLKHMFLLGAITALREADLLSVEEYELAFIQAIQFMLKEELECLLKLCM